MKYTIILLSSLAFCINAIYAQQNGRMETDRPDQTESPFLTRLHYFQGEIGLTMKKHRDSEQ